MHVFLVWNAQSHKPSAHHRSAQWRLNLAIQEGLDWLVKSCVPETWARLQHENILEMQSVFSISSTPYMYQRLCLYSKWLPFPCNNLSFQALSISGTLSQGIQEEKSAQLIRVIARSPCPDLTQSIPIIPGLSCLTAVIFFLQCRRMVMSVSCWRVVLHPLPPCTTGQPAFPLAQLPFSQMDPTHSLCAPKVNSLASEFSWPSTKNAWMLQHVLELGPWALRYMSICLFHILWCSKLPSTRLRHLRWGSCCTCPIIARLLCTVTLRCSSLYWQSRV